MPRKNQGVILKNMTVIFLLKTQRNAKKEGGIMANETYNLILPKEYEEVLSERIFGIIKDLYEDASQQGKKEFITLADAKRYTDTTYATLMKWVKEKGLSMYKIDGKIFFSLDDINEFIKSHKI